MQNVRLTIPGQTHTYGIFVGEGLLKQANGLLAVGSYSKVFVITDKNTERLWLPELSKALPGIDASISLAAGEQAKRIGNVQRVWTAMRQAGCDRKSLVLILGGGVIGDIGAFAASTYMRGVAFVHIPTTLLAQVDSSVGGKTGFDFDNLKNLIGTFAQPVAVLVDTSTLSTLPKRELVAGFAEMLKHGLIQDAAYFEKLAQKPPIAYSAEEMVELIVASIRIKAAIVQSDEKEAGDRKLINFGHTVGHAIEALSWETDRPLLHGEAVAIGMVVEAELSRRKGLLGDSEVQRLRRVIQTAGLPVRVPPFSLKRIQEKMYVDKKNERGVILFTLLQHIGEAVHSQIVPERMVVEVVEQYMQPESSE